MDFTQAIYIQGCARSGNTLMRELCVAGFRNTEMIKESETVTECSLAFLIEKLESRQQSASFAPSNLIGLFRSSPTSPHALLVAGRNRDASLSMDAKLLLANPGIKLIWMLRDPRDVLTSKHARRPGEFYVQPERLLKSLELYQRFKNEAQVMTVRYEDLVSDPNAIQARIAQAFQIEPAHDFTECHRHFTRDENVLAMHEIRPIDAQSVQKWRANSGYKQHLEKVLAEHPTLISQARDLGFEMKLV